ncbi:hypothetical protein GCM10027080_25800 [Pedococcus soli]
MEPSAAAGPRRTRGRALGMGIVVVVMVVVGLTWAARYDPLVPGSLTGLDGATAGKVHDPIFGDAFVINGDPGTRATFVYSLRNDGRLPVRLRGVNRDAGLPEDLTIRWGTPVKSSATRPTDTPVATTASVELGPGEQVPMWVSVSKPDCADGSGISEYLETIPVEWSALVIPHVHDVTLTPTRMPFIVLCRP